VRAGIDPARTLSAHRPPARQPPATIGPHDARRGSGTALHVLSTFTQAKISRNG